MTPEERERELAARRKEYMQSDFEPGYTRSSLPPPDLRLANAAEYAAFQLGQINRNLARLVGILEKRN